MEVTIRKTATTTDWRELRGAACVVLAPKSSDHLCKPTRSTQPRVAPFSAPRYPRYTLSDKNCAIKSATEYTLRKSPSANSWTWGRVLVHAMPSSAPLS